MWGNNSVSKFVDWKNTMKKYYLSILSWKIFKIHQLGFKRNVRIQGKSVNNYAD